MSHAHRQPRVADVAAIWWPLGASWIFMALELPIVSAALARFPNPEVQLAAFGGIVYPLMLLIESPVMMLLAASTALSRDWPSYRALRAYMNRMSAGLTAFHLLLALTPLYGLVVLQLIDPPEAIIAPARIGLVVAVPWTWSIAYRRFNQGFLIRHGVSRPVGVGTMLRLATTTSVLVAGLWLQASRLASLPGVALGTLAVIAGVVAEACFIGWRTRPVVAEYLDPSQEGEGPDLAAFLRFYAPLALTSLLALLIQPVGSAAISRMPRALESLAGWPVVVGIVFVLRSAGTAYKEVVVAVLDRPRPLPALRRFTQILSGVTLALTALVAFTPMADLWLVRFSGCPPAWQPCPRHRCGWRY